MRTGVVVMAYGTPARPEDLEAFYTHIRRGRPPTAEQLAELRSRYDAIGGTSQMAERTRAQVSAVASALEDLSGTEASFHVALGQKHASPFIEEAVEEILAAGAQVVVGLVLAPHHSRASVGQYLSRARDAAESGGATFRGVESWHLEPAFVTHQAASLRRHLERMPERTKVLFTAHSLPESALEGDPYPDQLRASAQAIAEKVGLGRWSAWGLGWQSAGRTPEPWRGPDILEIIRDLAATGRADGILVVPQGFTTEHLEVSYDLDIEAAGVAGEVGLAFDRTDVVDDDPDVMSALARRVATLAATADR